MKSVSPSLKRGVLGVVLCVSAALALLSAPAKADVVDLKVLIFTIGLDSRFLLVREALSAIGVPFDVVDVTTENLTPARLSDGGTHGFYNGIILTDTELQPHFSSEEWNTLRAYEVRFRVREAVISGFPAINPSLGLDYGMAGASISGVSSLAGRWVAPTGGKERVEYVTTGGSLPITDFAWCATPRTVFGGTPVPGDTGPTVQALLVDAANPACTLVSVLRYPDGREVMLSTIASALFLIHSQVLGYEFITFATRGVFIGARFVYLSAHADDLFYDDDIWDPVTDTTPPGTNNYRPMRISLTQSKRSRRCAPRIPVPTRSDWTSRLTARAQAVLG